MNYYTVARRSYVTPQLLFPIPTFKIHFGVNGICCGCLLSSTGIDTGRQARGVAFCCSHFMQNVFFATRGQPE